MASTASHRWHIGVVLVIAAGIAIKAAHAFASPPASIAAASKQSNALQKPKGTRDRGRRSREVRAAEQEPGAAKKGEYRPRQEYTGLIDTPTTMTMETIAVVRSPYKERFGTPRQANVTAGVLDGKVCRALFQNDVKHAQQRFKHTFDDVLTWTIHLLLFIYSLLLHSLRRRSKGTSCLQKGGILSTH